MDGHPYSSSSDIKPLENNSSEAYVLPDRNPFRYDDDCKGIEFPVRNFWKLAKIQNDIESLNEGHCNGFYYRLLLHPRGTAGTDSESNHLSVFLEAVVQDWYPEYWVFPNVRFELAVVNFKDPKLSVTSWAHWSFSSDATSRGWQKMISHSKLTKAAGFMDDEGTILVRGKAEPPYPRLWSHVFPYRPTRLWSSLRSAATYDLSDGSNSCQLSDISESTDTNYAVCVNPYHEHEKYTAVMDKLLAIPDSLIPSIQPTLDSDVLSLFVSVLYNIKEFRKAILSFPSEELSALSNSNYTLISALQETFAYMYMYPIAAIAKAKKGPRPLGLSVEDFYLNEITSDRDQIFTKNFLSFPIYFEPSLHVNCSAVDCVHCNYKNSLYNRSGERVSPTVPNVKKLLLTLHMNDLQYLEVTDPIIKIHTSIFTMLLRDLALAKKATKQMSNKNIYTKAGELSSELESACTRLFSPSHYVDGLFRSTADDSIGDLSSVYIKCKHIYSLQKSLEASGRIFARYPDILFFYLQPNKNTKKGELFDVPLRLDATCLVPHYSDVPTMTNTIPGVDLSMDLHDNTSDRPDLFTDSQNCSFDSEYRRAHQAGYKSIGDKWYSLYALIIREGDSSVPHTFSLLIRPDEDGLWYRISDGRIERLETKMEFTEWKCHREFFCASAVYISEDYIDTIQAREVDLSGDLRLWNRELYMRTLDKLGINELDITFEKYNYNDLLDYYHPRCNNVLIRRYNIGMSSVKPCLLHGFTKDNLSSFYYQTMKKSCIYLDSFQAVSVRLKRLALLQPLMTMLLTELANPAQSQLSAGNTNENLLSKCLELEFITSFGEIFFSERIVQLLYDGAEVPPSENQLHLTPQGRLFGFHVTMLLIQPLRNLFASVLDFIKSVTSGETIDNLFNALQTFCGKVIELYAECDSLLSLSGSRIRNIHYVIIDELRGTVKNGGSEFINHHLGLSCDFLNPKYDLPLVKTNELMSQLNAQYGLPNLYDMLCFLRQHGVYLHGLIRPHEIARMYIQVRFWNSNDSSLPFNVSFTPNSILNSSTNTNPNQTMVTPSANNSISPVLNRTLNPLKSALANNITWNEELFVGVSSWTDKSYIDRGSPEKIIQNLILKILIHSMPHSSQLVDQEHLDLITELDLLNLSHFAVPSDSADNSTCTCPPPPPSINPSPSTETNISVYKQIQSLYALLEVDQKMANEVDPLIFPAPAKPGVSASKSSSLAKELTSGKNSLDGDALQKTSLVTSNSKGSTSKGSVSSDSVSPKSINSASLSADDNMHFPVHSKPQSLARSLSESLDPEFRRLLGERLFNSPLFNDLFSMPDVQCGDLFSHVVSDVCTIQVGLIFSNDLFGLEGFCIEDKIFPFRRLTVNIELSLDNNKDISQRGYGLLARAEHLYWGLHKLFSQILPEEVGYLGYTPSESKKNKSKSGDTPLTCCINECLTTGDECISTRKWKATSSRDGFFLYALRSDIDPSRRAKKRFIYMHPDVELASYIDPRKTKKMPGLVVLVAFAPPSLIQTPTLFPLPDDSGYPLLIFKWMCTDRVELLTVGAIVCDSKCHLQYYITENVLPFVDELGYMLNPEEDFSKFIVFEECGVRALQNVRRCSCAIRKINKRTGDVIVLQLKRQADSPASLKYKDTAALISCIKELEEMSSISSLPPAAIPDPANFEGSFLTLGSIPPASIDPPPEIQDENSHIHTTTSDANVTVDGNSVFAEDEQSPDDDKRLSVVTKKKGKSKRKVVIPCNKKSTFNKQVVIDDSTGATLLSSNNLEYEKTTDLDVCITEFEQAMNNMFNEFDISKCSEIGKSFTGMIKLLETQQKEEFLKFIGNFFNLHIQDAHIVAPVFACIQPNDFSAFPQNTSLVKFLLVSLSYLADLSDEDTQTPTRTIFQHLLSLNVDYSEIKNDILDGDRSGFLQLLQRLTQLILLGSLLRNDVKILANKIGLSTFQINPELLLECNDDYVIVLEKQDLIWSLDYPFVKLLPSAVVLAKSPIEVGVEGDCCYIEVNHTRVSVMLPKEHPEESEQYVLGDQQPTSMQYGVGEQYLMPSELDSNWDVNHLQTRRMRRLRVLQAQLLRNLACLLLVLQRRVQILPSSIKWPKLIFGQSGELLSISLPNGVIVGNSSECSQKKVLVDSQFSISHGESNWRFLILLACNAFRKYFAASICPNDQGIVVWISSKFIDNLIIPDAYVYDLKNLFDQSRALLEQIQANVNLTCNFMRHVPNLPINPSHVLQKFGTLLLTRMNMDYKPCRKMFLPLEPPQETLPTILSRISIKF